MKKIIVFSAALILAAVARTENLPLKFAETDTDKDGVITKKEWIARHKVVNPDASAGDVMKWFRFRDKNKDNQVTPDELP